MKIIIFIYILLIPKYSFANKLYDYENILSKNIIFKDKYYFTYYTDYEEYLKDPDEVTIVNAVYKTKNLKFVVFKDQISINNKKVTRYRKI